MKTYKHLYVQIHRFENLYHAYRKARRGGKRKHEPAAAFELDLESNLIQLRDELREKTYQPGRYRHFYICERKRRLISAAPFRDRVVHHSLCSVIEPLFERRPKNSICGILRVTGRRGRRVGGRGRRCCGAARGTTIRGTPVALTETGTIPTTGTTTGDFGFRAGLSSVMSGRPGFRTTYGRAEGAQKRTPAPGPRFGATSPGQNR